MSRRLFALLLALLLTGCAAAPAADPPPQTAPALAEAAPAPTEAATPPDELPKEETNMIALTVGGRQFTAELLDNETAGALRALLPARFAMTELNGNEKYVYLDRSLPTAPESVGRIEAGDLMLFGDDCLVLFYESFSTPYRYTRLGRVGDAAALAEALGAGGAEVVFEEVLP